MSLSRLCSHHGMCATEVGPGSVPKMLHDNAALNNYSSKALSDQGQPWQGAHIPHHASRGNGWGRGQFCYPGLSTLSSHSG